jgi:chromosome segregation ATPase
MKPMTSDGGEGKVVRELIEANCAIISLRTENARLYGIVPSLRSEIRDLRQEVEDLQDKLRIRDEEWLKESQASPEWAGFRAGCLNHVEGLKKIIEDLRRQLEAEREARVRESWLDSRPSGQAESLVRPAP